MTFVLESSLSNEQSMLEFIRKAVEKQSQQRLNRLK